MPSIDAPKILTHYWQTSDHNTVQLYQGNSLDVLKQLPDQSVHTVVTSPPYWGLRDYGTDKSLEIGSEATPQEFVQVMVTLFHEVRRVLRNDGTLWLNLGSSYWAGSIMSEGNESITLRDDLTPDQIQYVLAELATHFRKCGKIAKPN